MCEADGIWLCLCLSMDYSLLCIILHYSSHEFLVLPPHYAEIYCCGCMTYDVIHLPPVAITSATCSTHKAITSATVGFPSTTQHSNIMWQ